MLLRRALLETPAAGVSTVHALKRCPRRELITEAVRKDRSGPGFDRTLGPKVYREVRSKNARADRRGAIASTGEKKFLSPYELSKRVKASSDKGDLKEAIAKVKEAPRDAQNTKVWGSLINEVIQAGMYKEAYRLFTDMKRRGFAPTTRTYSTMFGGYTNIDDWGQYSVQLENVISLYSQMQRHHEEVKRGDPHSPELSEIPYTLLIRIFGQAQQFQRMFDVFNSLPSEGPLAPSVQTYTVLLNAIANRKASALVPSESILREVGQDEVPSEPSYHELMFKNSTDAKLIWRQLVQASAKPPGFRIDSHALRALLKILGRGRPSDQNFAFDIVHEYFGLAKPGQQPIPPKVDLHPLTLESLLMACNNAKRYNLTLHYAQQVIDSDSGSLGQHPLGLRRMLNTRHMDIVLEAHAARASLGSSDESEDALDTLEWMHRMQAIAPSPGKEGGIGPQIRPTTNTYDLVLLTCWRSGDWKRACRVFDLMTGYNASQFRGDMREPPQQELRSKGRNLVPTPNFMTYFVRAASKTHHAEDMRLTLNIFEHYGWDTFFTVDHSKPVLSQKERKGRTLFASKLAQTLAQVLPALLKLGNIDHETRARWAALQRRAESTAKTGLAQGEGADITTAAGATPEPL